MFSGDSRYVLEDLGNGHTRLSNTGQYRFGNWFARLMTPLVMSQAGKKMKEDLERLKVLAEKS